MKEIRKYGRVCDIILGVFMITIGFYGILGALKTYKEKRMKRRDLHVKDSANLNLILTPHSELLHCNNENSNPDVEESYTDTYAKSVHDHSIHGHDSCECCQILPFIDMHDSTTQKVVSFFIGILHGVAGPGAILGVLPAVEMQSWRASTCYLGSFIVASTLSMGTFAAIYGEVTKRIGSTAVLIELILRVFSSSLSIIVGALWLILSLLGKLEGLFH